MNKKEVLDLIVKGFGVYLLVLAIIAIPKMFGAFFLLPFMVGQDLGNESLATTVRYGVISDSVVAIAKFIIYIIASINFLRKGTWVKKLMGCEKVAEQDNQRNGT
ncbi:MAG: hypothetical protein ACYTBP_11670 [Planctomycetota bacterium]|jgi:cytochrome c oxidase assembly factor CtaG